MTTYLQFCSWALISMDIDEFTPGYPRRAFTAKLMNKFAHQFSSAVIKRIYDET
jgi:hypothetical protein